MPKPGEWILGSNQYGDLPDGGLRKEGRKVAPANVQIVIERVARISFVLFGETKKKTHELVRKILPAILR